MENIFNLLLHSSNKIKSIKIEIKNLIANPSSYHKRLKLKNFSINEKIIQFNSNKNFNTFINLINYLKLLIKILVIMF
jgi:hypothetical protein